MRDARLWRAPGSEGSTHARRVCECAGVKRVSKKHTLALTFLRPSEPHAALSSLSRTRARLFDIALTHTHSWRTLHRVSTQRTYTHLRDTRRHADRRFFSRPRPAGEFVGGGRPHAGVGVMRRLGRGRQNAWEAARAGRAEVGTTAVKSLFSSPPAPTHPPAPPLPHRRRPGRPLLRLRPPARRRGCAAVGRGGAAGRDADRRAWQRRRTRHPASPRSARCVDRRGWPGATP